jgi:hypothetical protein
MHFRRSTVAGVTLGEQVAGWGAEHHFGRRP